MEWYYRMLQDLIKASDPDGARQSANYKLGPKSNIQTAIWLLIPHFNWASYTNKQGDVNQGISLLHHVPTTKIRRVRDQLKSKGERRDLERVR